MEKKCYEEYIESRFSDKSASIHDTITANRNYLKIPTTSLAPKPSKRCLNNDTVSDVVRYIDYAQLRGYDTQQLLSYELTAFAFYLEKNDDKLHSI